MGQRKALQGTKMLRNTAKLVFNIEYVKKTTSQLCFPKVYPPLSIVSRLRDDFIFTALLMTENNQGTPAPERLQPSGLVRRFLSRDKTPVSVLFLSALVGLGAGLLSTLFEIAVHWYLSSVRNGCVMRSAICCHYGCRPS